MQARFVDLVDGVDWGGLCVERTQYPAGLDAKDLLEGLPDNLCPCPHWGYVVKGRFVIRYAGHEETLETGDAFYMAPGHAPEFFEDTEVFELSPAAEMAEVMKVVNVNLHRLGVSS